jgi:hypothetical protein
MLPATLRISYVSAVVNMEDVVDISSGSTSWLCASR